MRAEHHDRAAGGEVVVADGAAELGGADHLAGGPADLDGGEFFARGGRLGAKKALGAGWPALLEEIGSETAYAGAEVREFNLAIVVEPTLHVRWDHAIDDLVDPSLSRSGAFDGHQLSVDSKHHRGIDLNVDV